LISLPGTIKEKYFIPREKSQMKHKEGIGFLADSFSLLLFFYRQPIRQLLDDKEIIVDPEKYQCHHQENDQLIYPIGSLQKD
jgi:hypothetical protein